MSHQDLTITNDMTCLPQVREFVRSGVEQGDFPREFLNRLQIAVDEAISNIIEHGYSGVAGGSATIALHLTVDAETFRIEIEDDGSVFDPKNLPEVDIRKHAGSGRAGGLGVFLMRRVMDQIEYHYQHGKRNKLILIKRK